MGAGEYQYCLTILKNKNVFSLLTTCLIMTVKVVMFTDPSHDFAEYNVILSKRNDDQSYKNKTQVVIKQNVLGVFFRQTVIKN